MKKEKWKWIPGYEGLYKINRKGMVRSVTRMVKRRTQPPFFLKGRVLTRSEKNKYYFVTLWKNNRYKNLYLHRLLLICFVGPPPTNKSYGCHKDDNRKNNKINNLYWGTAKTNSEDAIHNGLPVGRPLSK